MGLFSFPDQVSECRTLLESVQSSAEASFVTRTMVGAGHNLYSPPLHLIGIHLGQPLVILRRTADAQQIAPLHPGAVLIMPSGTALESAHALATDTLYLHLSPGKLDQFASSLELHRSAVQLGVQLQASDPALARIGQAIHEELRQPGFASQLYLDTLWMQVCIHLIRYYLVDSPPIEPFSDGPQVSRLDKAIDFIHTHLSQNISLNDLAAVEALSPFHFSRRFKQLYGVTPHQYIIQQRIAAAQNLLKHPDLTVSEIAERVGFANHSHLIRHFKRLTGTTPRQ